MYGLSDASYRAAERSITRFEFRASRRQGYLTFTIFGFMFLFVTRKGFHGNCYGLRRVFRFDFGCGVHRLKFEFVNKRRQSTTIYFRRWLQPWKWNWNSEWIACKWGECQNEDGTMRGAPIGYFTYEGKFGSHSAL